MNIARQNDLVGGVCGTTAELHRLNLMHIDGLSNKSLLSANRRIGPVCSNNYRADRLNGQTAEVVAIDTQGASMVLQRED